MDQGSKGGICTKLYIQGWSSNEHCDFNDAQRGIISILQKLAINAGMHASRAYHKMDRFCVQQSVKRAHELSVKKRVTARQAIKTQEEHNIDEEGIKYEAGAF